MTSEEFEELVYKEIQEDIRARKAFKNIKLALVDYETICQEIKSEMEIRYKGELENGKSN